MATTAKTKTTKYHVRRCMKSKKKTLAAETKYYIFQKLIGIFAIVFGILAGIWIESIAPVLIISGIGLAFLFSKGKILMVGNVYWNENPIHKEEE